MLLLLLLLLSLSSSLLLLPLVAGSWLEVGGCLLLQLYGPSWLLLLALPAGFGACWLAACCTLSWLASFVMLLFTRG